jgi:hypothetical protein
MAVLSTPLTSSMVLQVQTGVDGEGNPVYKNRTYNRVKTSADDQNIFDVALALADLQKNTLSAVSRIDKEDLSDAG